MKFHPALPSFLLPLARILLVLGLLAAGMPGTRAATYTWSGPSGSSWSTGTEWTPNVTGGLGSADTAVIGDTGSTRVILYDAGASGAVGALDFVHTSASAGQTDTLQIIKPTSAIDNSFTLGSGGGTGTEQLFLDPSLNQSSAAGSAVNLTVFSSAGAGTGTVTVATGGLLSLGSYAFWNGTAYSASIATLTGNVNLSGGTVSADTTLSNDASHGIGGPATDIVTGSLTMGGGTLSVANGNSTQGSRLQVNGNFTVTGGAIAAGSGSQSGGLFLLGATNSIGGTATYNTGLLLFLAGSGNQSLSSTTALGTVFAQSFGNATKTISGTTLGKISFRNTGAANQTTAVKLGSNLTLTGAPDIVAGSNPETYGFDLAGFTLNLGSNAWTPANGVSWGLIDSVSGDGTVSAGSYNFSSATQVNVGGTLNGTSSTGAIVLQATGTGADNLGSAGTIDPNSLFLYTGSSATLTSGRTIGRLQVGNGSSSSTLKLVTANFSTAGDVAVRASSTLDLGGRTLTLGTAANPLVFLRGTGLLTSTSAGGVLAFYSSGGAAGTTGGISPGDAAGSIGTLTLGGGSSTAINLASSSASLFDIAGTSSFDTVMLDGAGIGYAGQLQLNFTYAPVASDSFALFRGAGTESGAFSSITSNIGGATFSFDAATGIVTVAAVPEPGTWAMFLAGGGLFLFHRRKASKAFLC